MREQSLIVMADIPNSQVRLVRRADGKVVTRFGHFGSYAGQLDRLHMVSVDSKGNIYTGEAAGKRVQKFTLDPALDTARSRSPEAAGSKRADAGNATGEPTLRFRHHRWADIPEEPLKDTITRRMISAERMMIAQVFLKKGDEVPQHSHHNEQLTYIVSGALRFLLGEHGEDEVVVKAGEVLVIPSHLPHSAVALEDTLDVDVFSPPREDWLNKTDDYLRKDGLREDG